MAALNDLPLTVGADGSGPRPSSLTHQVLANLGNDLWLRDQPWQALDKYRRAAQLAPSDPVVYRGLGNVYTDLQAFEAAERAYALSLKFCHDPVTAWNLSQVLIGLEHYGQGYALAECRWQMSAANSYRDPTTAWQAEPDGFRRPLLVWSEQGLGDTLQHIRWLGCLVAALRRQGTPLILEVEDCLVALLQEGLAHLDHPLKVRAKHAEAKAIDPHDWEGRHVSLMSLPHLLEPTPRPRNGCWLQSPRWQADSCPRPSGSAEENCRVGLVWAAGRKLHDPVTARDYWRRSLDPASLEQLVKGLHALGGQWMFLQFGEDRDQVSPWVQGADGMLDADADFLATADVVSQLDLVISVDTAMAHLLGAMGQEAWVLLPFSAAPRWLRGCATTPWYPSLRLFRQPQVGDWKAVVQDVLAALRQRLGSPD